MNETRPTDTAALGGLAPENLPAERSRGESAAARMKFAYADPPYLGCGKMYAAHHPDALTWDDPETHRALIDRLCDEYPDGWAMSLSSPSMRTILPMCPDDCRWGVWVKPFAVFKPNVNPAYVFEPVIWRGGRRGDRTRPTVRDWISANITLRRGLTGAKPRAFCRWIFGLLGAERGDTLDDLFPGTGAVSAAWADFTRAAPIITFDLEACGSGMESRNAGSNQTVTAESDPLVTAQNQPHD
jgi:hypothetical protein